MDASDAVVLLTALPLGGLLIADGTLGRHVAEIASGLVVVLLVGGPGLLRGLATRLLTADEPDEGRHPHG